MAAISTRFAFLMRSRTSLATKIKAVELVEFALKMNVGTTLISAPPVRFVSVTATAEAVTGAPQSTGATSVWLAVESMMVVLAIPFAAA